jgi:L-fucose mutarotase
VVERMAFYELTRRPEVTLAVATGDQRLYANLLLTIGYIDPAVG